MPFVQGFLRIRRGGGGGHPDQGLPGGGGGEIDNALPGDQPGIDHELPEPPPGIWPPPGPGNPIVPIGPDNTLPVQPGTIWPSPGGPPHISGGPVRPPTGSTQPLPGGGRPDNTLPAGGGGQIDNTLPSKTYWMIAYSPSLGWKYIAVDPSLRPGYPLPPAAQPK